jgi:hypothetical protein
MQWGGADDDDDDDNDKEEQDDHSITPSSNVNKNEDFSGMEENGNDVTKQSSNTNKYRNRKGLLSRKKLCIHQPTTIGDALGKQSSSKTIGVRTP